MWNSLASKYIGARNGKEVDEELVTHEIWKSVLTKEGHFNWPIDVHCDLLSNLGEFTAKVFMSFETYS